MGYIPWNEKEIQASYCTVTELKGMAVESCNVCWRLAILSRWKVGKNKSKKFGGANHLSIVCNFTNMAHCNFTILRIVVGILCWDGLRFTDSILWWINSRQGGDSLIFLVS